MRKAPRGGTWFPAGFSGMHFSKCPGPLVLEAGFETLEVDFGYARLSLIESHNIYRLWGPM